MKKIRLEKHFTRDYTLATTDWWRLEMNERFTVSLGVGFDDYPATSDGIATTYYGNVRDESNVREAALAIIHHHPDRMAEFLRQCRADGAISRRIIAAARRHSVLSLPTLNLLLERHRLLYPGLRLSIRIPSRWEQDVKQARQGALLTTLAFDVRRRTDGIFEEIDLLLRRQGEVLLRRHSAPSRFAKFLRLRELIQLTAGLAIDFDVVKKRQRGFVFARGEVTPTARGEAALRRLGYIVPRDVVSGSIVRGQIAFAAPKVIGRVRMLNAIEQLRAFRPGEILVSTMTVPPFVPAMKIAKAIVTDEGGVTCHAAIVAREMKKPCVIGTKVATKVFKDGDRVEVDATKGIVRRIP